MIEPVLAIIKFAVAPLEGGPEVAFQWGQMNDRLLLNLLL